MKITPHVIHVEAAMRAELDHRLERSRYFQGFDIADWRAGTSSTFLSELCDYWRFEFAWDSIEATLNKYGSWCAEIDGEQIQFLHVQSQHENSMPLLLLHGWPSTIYEFHKAIDSLVSPTDTAIQSFDLVVPSIPGFTWSGPLRGGVWDVRHIARGFLTLMKNLGYSRFAIQGGDWGSIIATEMALAEPDAIIGIHLNYVLVRPPALPMAGVTEEELELMDKEKEWAGMELAYDEIQSTKPDTLGAALSDSAVGLASWIVEKYRSWSDCGGDVETRFTKDDLLATIASYWYTNTITSSMRLYWACANMVPRVGFDGKRINVATAYASFPAEISHPPRAWVEQRYKIERWTQMPAGGHFPWLEVPNLMIDDVREFFKTCGPD